MRTSYVQIDGILCEKNADGSATREGVRYVNVGGHWTAEGSPVARSFYVMSDIEPYKSVIDGSVISSRSRHREHLRAHGCIEVGNERPKAPTHQWDVPKGLRQELAARIYG